MGYDQGQEAISADISRLERFPESVPPFSDEYRILTVPFGKRGDSIAYVYLADTDEVVVLVSNTSRKNSSRSS